MNITVTDVTELVWPFDGQPVFYTKDGSWQRSHKADPFPAYAHNTEIVTELARQVNAAMPLDGTLNIYNVSYEHVDRVNGYASPTHYSDEPYSASIVLSGKRIPPHPAMTRYLVPHEYGHVVQYWVEHTHRVRNLVAAYVKDLRQVELPPNHYGGRTWHLAPGEVFANDFRIMVCKREPEFWPHQGFLRPEMIGPVVEFWCRAKDIGWESALAMLPTLERKNDGQNTKTT